MLDGKVLGHDPFNLEPLEDDVRDALCDTPAPARGGRGVRGRGRGRGGNRGASSAITGTGTPCDPANAGV